LKGRKGNHVNLVIEELEEEKKEILVEELYEMMGLYDEKEYKKKMIGFVNEPPVIRSSKSISKSKDNPTYTFHMPGYNSDGTLKVKKNPVQPEVKSNTQKKPNIVVRNLKNQNISTNILRTNKNNSLPVLKTPVQQNKYLKVKLTSIEHSAKPSSIPEELSIKDLTWKGLKKMSYKDILGNQKFDPTVLVMPSKDDPEILKILKQLFPNQDHMEKNEVVNPLIEKRQKPGFFSQAQSEDHMIHNLKQK